jgi:hypothetical protein
MIGSAGQREGKADRKNGPVSSLKPALMFLVLLIRIACADVTPALPLVLFPLPLKPLL